MIALFMANQQHCTNAVVNLAASAYNGQDGSGVPGTPPK
jgi:hypothetical protein